MNFDLNSEQQLLKDSVERFVADNYSLEARIKVTDAEPGFSKTHWKSFADLGWLGVAVRGSRRRLRRRRRSKRCC